jgi:hypothetical protein
LSLNLLFKFEMTTFLGQLFFPASYSRAPDRSMLQVGTTMRLQTYTGEQSTRE